MNALFRNTFLMKVSFGLLLIIATLSCQRDSEQKPGLPNILIENDKIDGQENVSKYFDATTIEVNGVTAARIPGKTRNFEYADSTIFLIFAAPSNQIIAVHLNGNIAWDLVADSDEFTSFSSLSAYHFDLENRVIKILDHQKHRIYVYDFEGTHQITQKVPAIYINDFFVLPTKERLFSVTSNKNVFERDGEKAALVTFSEENNTTDPDQVLLTHPFYNPDRIPFTDSHDFFRDREGNLFFHIDFGDTLFQINDISLKPRLTYSFAKNDRRKQILTEPTGNPIILSQLLEQNIPYSNFISLLGDDYFTMSYTYNGKEFFTMIDLKNLKTLINTELFQCQGKNFSGRLDYASGVFLNQMYAGNYKPMNGQEDTDEFDDSSLIYTILIPK